MLERKYPPTAPRALRVKSNLFLLLLLTLSSCNFGLSQNTTIKSAKETKLGGSNISVFPGSDSGSGNGDNPPTTTLRGDTPGVYSLTDETFYIRTDLESGSALALTRWSPSCPPESTRIICPIDIPIVGDWDGDGYTTVGIYQPTTGQFRIRSSYNENIPGDEIQFIFGPPSTADQPVLPIIGDWNNDGVDTIGVYLPKTSTFFLKNSLSAGVADITAVFGDSGNTITYPIAGDWDGDGVTGIGIYKPEHAQFFLKNTPSGGVADYMFEFGPKKLTLQPIAGKWLGTAQDFVGIYEASEGGFYLRFQHSPGPADRTILFGPSLLGEYPISGYW